MMHVVCAIGAMIVLAGTALSTWQFMAQRGALDPSAWMVLIVGTGLSYILIDEAVRRWPRWR